MAYQTIFKRYEMKYILTTEQKNRLREAMAEYMLPDQYGHSTIRNIYFDTENYRLIRRSIEKPAYKEKLRIRSYDTAEKESTVFVELKKKYESVVYKRRLSMKECEAESWLSSITTYNDMGEKEAALPGREGVAGKLSGRDRQIAAEIEYFCGYYPRLHPVVFLSYEREACYMKEDRNFRVTFDENILARTRDLSLEAEPGGIPLMEEGLVLMELKTAGGIPLWMTRLLSSERLYKTSFSKYGTAYKKMIFPERKGGYLHV